MEEIKQTGYIHEDRPTDYILGVNSPLKANIINESGDWIPFKPEDEKQYKDAKFDTMSCATFAFMNVIETTVNYIIEKKLLTDNQLDKIQKLGFIKNGKFNCSDRFIAIMSNTTQNGNSIQRVGDAARNIGLIPEDDFPFEGNTWNEYHNKNLINQEMKDKALEILKILKINYVWTPINQISQALKECPLEIAIPSPNPYHAVQLIESTHIFDTYPPYLYTIKTGIGYAMKIVVTVLEDTDPKPEPEVETYKYFSPEGDPKMVGISPVLMRKLDKMREECGFSYVITSGKRSKEENDKLPGASSTSSHLLGLAADIRCRNNSERFKMLESALNNGILRIGIGDGYCHLDINHSKKKEVVWCYYK